MGRRADYTGDKLVPRGSEAWLCRLQRLQAGRTRQALQAAPCRGRCPRSRCGAGSWSQYVSAIGRDGLLVAVDLKEVGVSFPNGVSQQCNAFELNDEVLDDWTAGRAPPFDVILSDMAPKTTGVPFTDHVRSVELCDHALDLADRWLKPGGHFVCKVFQGEDEHGLRDRIKRRYKKQGGASEGHPHPEQRDLFGRPRKKVGPRTHATLL